MSTKLSGFLRARRIGVAAAAISMMALAGCATSQKQESNALRFNDPFEEANRDIHSFNKGVDRYFLRPVAYVYDEVTPAPVRLVVGNALNHLEAPRDFVSHLLMGELSAAGRTAMRFGVNTIVGAGGLLDPATEFDLPKEDADIAKVLANWGFEEGIYYEMPFLGPTTIRHAMGRLGDTFLSPTTYMNSAIGTTKTVVETVEFRAKNKKTIDSVFYDSADSYSTARAFYLQTRRKFEGQNEKATLDNAIPLSGEE